MVNNHSQDLTTAYNRLIHGYIHSQLLWLCTQLDLPSVLSQGTKNLTQLSQITQCPASILKRFLRGMCGLGLVSEVESEVYAKGPLMGFVSAVEIPSFDQRSYAAWGKVLDTVKSGEPAWDKVFGQSFYQYLDDNPAASQAFDWWNADSNGFLDSLIEQYDFSRFDSIVDLGGGQAALLLKLLQSYPALKGIVFDRQEVIDNTDSVLADSPPPADLTARLSTQAGSFFQQLPPNADAYILSRVLLNWHQDKVIEILRNTKQAMKTGSSLLIFDFYLPAPEHPAYMTMVTNDLNQLINFGGGLRTIAQWQALVESVGLKVTQFTTCESFPLFLLEAR